MNLATYHLNGTSVTAREAEVAAADFAGGVNKGGGNAPGIGINTGAVVIPAAERFTLLDQAEAARDPQDSQHIGGDGLGAGDQTNAPILAVQGADINDTLSLITAAAQATDGQGVEAGNTGTVNRTGATVEIGDVIWGTNTAA